MARRSSSAGIPVRSGVDVGEDESSDAPGVEADPVRGSTGLGARWFGAAAAAQRSYSGGKMQRGTGIVAAAAGWGLVYQGGSRGGLKGAAPEISVAGFRAGKRESRR